MPSCVDCEEKYYDLGNTFCFKCGTRLPEIDRATLRWRQAGQWSGCLLAIGALMTLGAGIALLFLGPTWFNRTESNAVLYVGIGLIAGGGLGGVVGVILIGLISEREVKLAGETTRLDETVGSAAVLEETHEEEDSGVGT